LLLRVENLSKTFGDNRVLDSVSLTLDIGQKIGLVGANGVGKSTLIKIIVDELAADRGAVAVDPRAELGYLPQSLAGGSEQTISQFIDASLGGLRQIEARLRVLEGEMAAGYDNLDMILSEYSRLSEQYERRGGYDVAQRFEVVAAGLGIDHLARTRLMGSLSGGEVARVGLATLLLIAPDLLILDEPTNHLDFAALDWLERYLQGYRGGLLVVSHDRRFLNQTVTAIVEIDEHTRRANHYAGAYDFYAGVKVQEQARRLEAYQRQRDEIHALRRMIKGKARQVAHNRQPRDGDKLAYNAKGEKVQETISRNVRAAEEKLRRIEMDPIPRPPKPLTINPTFDPDQLASRTPLIASGLGKRYGDRQVLDDVSFTLDHRSRTVILGPNGAGKSTLLKLLAGLEVADQGEVRLAPGVIVGYLDQGEEVVDRAVAGGIAAGADTLFDVYSADLVGDWETLKRDLLSYGLFTYPDLHKPAATLSVGQKRKLQIARLIAARANLLLLDEPTNHLSLDVLEEFEAALLDFPGPVIAVSHDRHFIARFANDVWTIDDGRLNRR